MHVLEQLARQSLFSFALILFILKERTRVLNGFEASKRVKVGRFELRFLKKSNCYAVMFQNIEETSLKHAKVKSFSAIISVEAFNPAENVL